MEDEGPHLDGAQTRPEGKVSTSAIERRLKTLERKHRLVTPGSRVHEAETIPPAGDASNDFIATHSGTENYSVFVAALRLTAPIQVFQASAAINTAVSSPAQDFGLAVYKYNFSTFDSSDPLSKTEPYNLRLIGKLGSGVMTGTAATRLNLTLTKDIVLDPRSGVYFIAYQTTEYGKWLCPGYSMGSYASRRGRKTNYQGEYAGDFPDQMTVIPESANVPWVALRSVLGVRLYGDTTTYDG